MKTPPIVHDSAIERFEQGIAAEQKKLAANFLNSLKERMDELNMSQSDMAFTLGKSRSYVSKLFTGNANLTIKSMVELAHSLDINLDIKIVQKKTVTAEKSDWQKRRKLDRAASL